MTGALDEGTAGVGGAGRRGADGPTVGDGPAGGTDGESTGADDDEPSVGAVDDDRESAGRLADDRATVGITGDAPSGEEGFGGGAMYDDAGLCAVADNEDEDDRTAGESAGDPRGERSAANSRWTAGPEAAGALVGAGPWGGRATRGETFVDATDPLVGAGSSTDMGLSTGL